MKPNASNQSQSEYRAGYQLGLKGSPEPRKEKGQAHYGGWLAGRADRGEMQPGQFK